MKRLVTHTFHSNLLVPKRIVEEAKAQDSPEARLEHVLLWIDAKQSSHFFRSGDEVFHKDNLDQPMYVDRIIRKSYGSEEEKRQKIVGVEIHFWEEQLIEDLV